MKHIVLFGASCGKCKKAETNIKMAVSKNNLDANYEKITDEKEMMKFNISYLPSVMIDNVVVFKGTIPTEKEIIKALNEKNNTMEKQTLVKEICPTTTQGRVKEGALLVAVRERDEVAALAYDVPNIINIPLSEFEERFNEVPKDKEVVMVCKGGGRSLRAAGFLINHGYTNLLNMEHGIIRWAQKGFQTKGDTSSVLVKTESSSCCGTSTNATTKDNASCCDSPNSDRSPCC